MDFQILQRLCLNSARGSAGSDRSARSRRASGLAATDLGKADLGQADLEAGLADRLADRLANGLAADRLADGLADRLAATNLGQAELDAAGLADRLANRSARSRSGFADGLARSNRFARGDRLARSDGLAGLNARKEPVQLRKPGRKGPGSRRRGSGKEPSAL